MGRTKWIFWDALKTGKEELLLLDRTGKGLSVTGALLRSTTRDVVVAKTGRGISYNAAMTDCDGVAIGMGN